MVGLIGLVSTYLDVIDRVNSYNDFGQEFRAINTLFDTDKFLFRKWAQNVGIGPGQLKDSHHKGLDDPETYRTVENVLISIQEVFEKTEPTFSRLQQPFGARSKLPLKNDLFSPGSESALQEKKRPQEDARSNGFSQVRRNLLHKFSSLAF